MTNIISLSILFMWPQSLKFVFSELSKKIDGDDKPDAWDLIDDGNYRFSRHNLSRYKQLGESGLKFTVHGPLFLTKYIDHNKKVRVESINRLKTSMLNAVELSPIAYVFHPAAIPKGFTKEQTKVEHYEFLEQINDYSKSIGLNAFIENHITNLDHMLTTPQEFLEFYDRTGTDLMMTFDAGHANMDGSAKTFVDKLYNKIGVVHVHDNNGSSDEHLGIGQGNINWNYIVRKLEDCNFAGPYIIESVHNPFETVRILRQLINGRP
jgi:sugar phosphate isomerase/epimerase